MKAYHIVFIAVISLFSSYTVSAQLITTCSGNGTAGYTGDGGLAGNASLNTPYDAAIDDSGNLYIADYQNNVVRKVTSAGTISTYAGNGTSGFSGDGGPAISASLGSVVSVAVDKRHNVYIVDQANNRLRKVDTAGIITTIAGDGTAVDTGDGGPAIQAQLYAPTSVAVDAAGNIYVGTVYRVRKIDATGTITTFAGRGQYGPPLGDGGPATAASIGSNLLLDADGAGNIYIDDRGFSSGGSIRKVDTAGIINTICYSDEGLAVDKKGNVYTYSSNRTIQKRDTSGLATTVAGNGQDTYFGDGMNALQASIHGVKDLAVDDAGNIYIIQSTDSRIRKVSSINGPLYLCMGNSGSMSNEVTGGKWSSSNPSIASIDSVTGYVTSHTAGHDTIFYTIGSIAAMSTLSVDTSVPSVSPIVGPASLCPVQDTFYTDATQGGLWAVTDDRHLAEISVHGELASNFNPPSYADTIYYIITNGCGADTAKKVVYIDSSYRGVINGIHDICPGDTLMLTDSISGGTWSCAQTAIATFLEPGILKGLQPGNAIIKYTLTGACGPVVSSQHVIVKSLAECQNAVTTINNEAGISVYPNPSNGNITVAINTTYGLWRASLYDLYGKIVLIKDMSMSSGKAMLDLSQLAKGTYLLKLQNGGDYKTRKIVIE